MTPTQAHLAVNHLPIIGAMLGLALVLFAVLRRGDRGVVHAATLVLALAGVGGVGAYLSGEESEDAAEERGIDHDTIEAHEDGAKLAVVMLLLSAGVGGWISWRAAKGAVPGAAMAGWVVVTGLAVGSMVRMGLTGREIGHPHLYGDGAVVDDAK
jgi:hypothetical protein